MLKYYQTVTDLLARQLLFNRGKGPRLLNFDKVDGKVGRNWINWKNHWYPNKVAHCLGATGSQEHGKGKLLTVSQF